MNILNLKGKIALIDNELSTRKNHSFPNLAIMKLSSYFKSKGCIVKLVNFDMINPNMLFNESYDFILISKVFTDTKTPEFINKMKNVIIGGSGFFYDKAEPLPYEIEHSFPDYDIYKNIKSCNSKYYTDFSIGFTTRGCIRQCKFCINRNYKKVELHSPISEFLDKNRKYIMLLDDNITASRYFFDIIDALNETKKQFVFKQGMDFRLLTFKKQEKIFYNSNYYIPSTGQQISARCFHFAFDYIEDYDKIEKRLKEVYYNRRYAFKMFFYVLVGFDKNDKYDNEFFKSDIKSTLLRIELLFKYYAYPYIMLHENYKLNPDFWVLNKLKNMCNNPAYITNKTMKEAILQKKEYNLLKYLQKNYNWFLDIKFNSKLPKP